MALKKEDYARLGKEDALAGNASRRPSIPGTWQYRAYMDAWQTQHDEKAVPKAVVVENFRQLTGSAFHTKQARKRTAGFMGKFLRNERIRAAEANTRRSRGDRYSTNLAQYMRSRAA